MEAITINRKLVDKQLHERSLAQERYNHLQWQVDRLIQFINITITGPLDAKILQKSIQQQIKSLGLSTNANLPTEKGAKP